MANITLLAGFASFVAAVAACGGSTTGPGGDQSSGLAGPAVCQDEDAAASALMQSKASAWSDPTCKADSDCALGPLGPECVPQGCGGTLVNRAGLAALNAAIKSADDMICTSQCVQPAPPCALPGGDPVPACRAGKCVFVRSSDGG